MGKSTVAALFARAGVPVFDADRAVHRLQAQDRTLIAAIEAAFPGTTAPNGVSRAALGARVLGDAAALARLERLVHPAVAREQGRFVRRHQAHRMVVLDIPLLLEKGGGRRVNHILVVSARGWQQRRRFLARPGMTAARLARIRALQMPDHAKRRRADAVIASGGTRLAMLRRVNQIIACVRRQSGG